MTKTVYTLHSLMSFDKKAKKFVETAPGTVLAVDRDRYDELVAKQAVRDATDAEVALFERVNGDPASVAAKAAPPPAEDDDNTNPPPPAALTPKHKGGGKFVVVDAEDNIVSEDELFDGKDAAQAWIDAQALANA